MDHRMSSRSAQGAVAVAGGGRERRERRQEKWEQSYCMGKHTYRCRGDLLAEVSICGKPGQRDQCLEHEQRGLGGRHRDKLRDAVADAVGDALPVPEAPI